MANSVYATVGGNTHLCTHVRNATSIVRVEEVAVRTPSSFTELQSSTFRSGTCHIHLPQRVRTRLKSLKICTTSSQSTIKAGEGARGAPPRPWRRSGGDGAGGAPTSWRKSGSMSWQNAKKYTYDAGRKLVLAETVQRIKEAHVAEQVETIVKEVSPKLGDRFQDWFEILDGLMLSDEVKNRAREARAGGLERREGEVEAVGAGEGEGLQQANIEEGGWPLIQLVFRTIQSQPFFKPTRVWYSKIITLAGRCTQPEASWKLLLEYQAHGLPPDTAVLNSIMKSLAIGGEEDRALEILRGMKQEGGVGVTIASYNVMVAALCRVGRVGEAEELVAELREAAQREAMGRRVPEEYGSGGLAPDSYTYTPLIHFYTKKFQWQNAEAVLDKVMEDGVELKSPKSFVSLISCFRNTKKWEAMGKAYSALKQGGLEVPVIAWKLLWEGFAYAGAMDQVEDLYFVHPCRVTLMPDVFSTLFKFAAKSRTPDPSKVAKKLFVYFERFCSIDWETTDEVLPVYNSAIEAFGALGSCDRMAEVLQSLLEQKLEPDAATFLAMVEGFAKNDMREEMDNVYLLLKALVPPTPEVYRSMLKVYERVGDVERAEETKLTLAELRKTRRQQLKQLVAA